MCLHRVTGPGARARALGERACSKFVPCQEKSQFRSEIRTEPNWGLEHALRRVSLFAGFRGVGIGVRGFISATLCFENGRVAPAFVRTTLEGAPSKLRLGGAIFPAGAPLHHRCHPEAAFFAARKPALSAVEGNLCTSQAWKRSGIASDTVWADTLVRLSPAEKM